MSSENAPFSLAPCDYEIIRTAQGHLNVLFPPWKNRIRGISASDPEAKRLEDHARIRRHGSLFSKYLTTTFCPSPEHRAVYEEARRRLALLPDFSPDTLRATYLQLPLAVAEDAADSLLAMDAVAEVAERQLCRDEHVEAFQALRELRGKIIILGRSASLGSGLRQWLALSQ